jgi:hypothetical protein
MEKGTGAPAGEFRYTLTATGAATGWTARYALRNKARKRVRAPLIYSLF